MLSIFGFNNSNRDVGFVIEDVIRALLLPSGCQLSANNDAPSRQIHFLADLSMQVPACSSKRSEEHTSELQSLMRISYAVFCLKKKKKNTIKKKPVHSTTNRIHHIHHNDHNKI